MKTVLITGASRGIGRALAEKFLSEGYFVIGTSRSGVVEFSHQHFLVFPLELTNAESREQCVNAIRATGKNIDVLINNAGIWHPGDETQMINVDVLRETLEANALGPIDFTERLLAAELITEQIVNISSRRGSLTNTTECLYPDYGISKTVLNMFTRILAARYKSKLIVSSIHPGFVQTDMNEGDGDISATEAAEDIYNLVERRVESGNFWFKGEQFSW